MNGHRPIIFDGWDVRALLAGRKTEMRIPVRNAGGTPLRYGRDSLKGLQRGLGKNPSHVWAGFGRTGLADNGDTAWYMAPYEPGDILYVKETWAEAGGIPGGYAYRTDWGPDEHPKWRSPKHMPEEASRMLLRVTDVTAERLNDMQDEDAMNEGTEPAIGADGRLAYSPCMCFIDRWDEAIKPSDSAQYGWDANPWVWIIKFEKIKKEDAA